MAETTARAGLTPSNGTTSSSWSTCASRASLLLHGHGRERDHPACGRSDSQAGRPRDVCERPQAPRQGVTGNQVLEGNEEELDSRSMAVTVGPVRNAVVVTDWDDQKSAIDLRNAGKTALKQGHGEDAKSDY